MRVLHIIEGLPRAGAENQLVRLCCRLARDRFEPGICSIRIGGPHETTLRAAGVPVWIVPKHGPCDPLLLARLARRIRRFRPQIVHTWLFTANTFGRAAAALCRVPCIIGSERAAEKWKSLRHRLADRRLARCSAAIITNAEATRRYCIEHSGLPAEKITVVYNGIDVAAFDRVSERGPAAPLPATERMMIGTVARLEEQKGLPFLLRAFAALQRPDIGLWIIGDGSRRRDLEAQAAELGLAPQSIFLGSRTDVPALLHQLDIFALPSLWEGMPNAVMEAMAAAKPVVATAVDGTPELVVDGTTGILVPPSDADGLRNALEQLLRDPDQRRRLGQAGRARIASEFTDERMVARMESLYEDLLAHTAAGRP